MSILREKISDMLVAFALIGATMLMVYLLADMLDREVQETIETRNDVAHCAAIRGEIKMINRYTSYCVSATETFEIDRDSY